MFEIIAKSIELISIEMFVFFNKFLISLEKINFVGNKLFRSDISEAKKSIIFRLKSLSCRHGRPTPPSKMG